MIYIELEENKLVPAISGNTFGKPKIRINEKCFELWKTVIEIIELAIHAEKLLELHNTTANSIPRII